MVAILQQARVSPSAQVRFEGETFPLVFVRFGTSFDLDDLRWLFSEFDHLFSLRRRYALIIDGSRMRPPTAVERGHIVSWEASRVEETRAWNVGAAIVASSSIVRAAMTAMNWFRRPATPQYYPPDVPTAIRWCCERLAERGVPETPALTRLRLSLDR